MICCYQVTKLFCSRCCFVSASAATGPCHFGPLAYLAIPVFREVTINTVFSQYLFPHRFFRRLTRRARGCVPPFLHEILFEFLQLFWQIRQPGLRVLARCPHFYWVFEFLAGSGDKSPCACSLTFSLRVVAGRIVEFSESCDDDVGDVGGQQVTRSSPCVTESLRGCLTVGLSLRIWCGRG